MIHIHGLLNRLDIDSLQIELLIHDALRMYRGYPPKLLLRHGPNRPSSCIPSFNQLFLKSSNLQQGINASRKRAAGALSAKRQIKAFHIGIIVVSSIIMYTWYSNIF